MLCLDLDQSKEKNIMSEQQSHKRGLKSEAQKEDEARDPYAPTASTSPDGGAFASQKERKQTDQDLALSQKTEPHAKKG